MTVTLIIDQFNIINYIKANLHDFPYKNTSLKMMSRMKYVVAKLTAFLEDEDKVLDADTTRKLKKFQQVRDKAQNKYNNITKSNQNKFNL